MNNSPNPDTITGRIYIEIFRLLEKHSEGLRWTDLNKMVRELNPSFHPKTINGCVWKLIEKYPDQVYKTPEKLFKLKNILNN